MARSNRLTFQRQLASLAANGTVIAEVVLRATDYTLMGVTVEEVQADYVVFNEGGSGGAGRVIVQMNNIVALNL